MAHKKAGMDRKYVLLSIFLLAYSVGLILVRTVEGSAGTLGWMSHAALLLATIGYILRNRFLLSSALVGVFLHHLLWIIDFFVVFVLDTPFLYNTAYFAELSVWAMLFDLHHFFLLPVLLGVLWEKGVHRYAWIGATALLALSDTALLLADYTNPNCLSGCASRSIHDCFLGTGHLSTN